VKETYKRLNIPLDAVYVDKKFYSSDFEVNVENFWDATAMFDQFHADGLMLVISLPASMNSTTGKNKYFS